MINLLVYFAVHGRHEILDVCLEGIRQLAKHNPEEIKVIPFAVCSSADDMEILERNDIYTVYHPNDYLGAKKNFGLWEAIKKVDFDYMFEIGSDDVISPKLLDIYLPMMKEGADYMSIDTFYMVDTISHKTACVKSDLIIGAGRCIRRDILERMYKVPFEFTVGASGPNFDCYPKMKDFLPVASAKNYEKIGYGNIIGAPEFVLWKPTIQHGLDTNSHWNILLSGKCKHQQIQLDIPYGIDIKSIQNIHPFSEFEPCEDSLDYIFTFFPVAVIIKLKRLMGLEVEEVREEKKTKARKRK